MTESITKHEGGGALAAMPTHPLEKLEDVARAFAEMKGRFIVLSPIAQIDHLMPMSQVSMRAVVLDPTVPGDNSAGTDCYHSGQFCGKGEVALGKNGLLKILGAAGASITKRERNDDRSDSHYCEITVYISHQDFDGVWRTYPGTREMDLRDGSEMAKGMLPKQLANSRRRIQELCETFAIERGIRGIFALQQKYKADDLRRMPFVIPKIVPKLDVNDPETKTALLNRALGNTQQLYGGPAQGEETRMLKDVTPARHAPPLRTQDTPDEGRRETSDPVRETPDSSPQREDNDDQLGLLDDVTEESGVKVCGCPCSCQVEVKEETAAATETTFGSIRCTRCAPGKGFDHGRHKDLKTLELAKYPTWTADFVKQQLEKKAAKAAAGR